MVASTVIGVFGGSNVVILRFLISSLVLSSLKIGSHKIICHSANVATQKVTG